MTPVRIWLVAAIGAGSAALVAVLLGLAGPARRPEVLLLMFGVWAVGLFTTSRVTARIEDAGRRSEYMAVIASLGWVLLAAWFWSQVGGFDAIDAHRAGRSH